MASMYGVYHGPDGLRRIAERVAQKGLAFSAICFAEAGLELENGRTTSTPSSVRVPGRAASLASAARDRDLLVWAGRATTRSASPSTRRTTVAHLHGPPQRVSVRASTGPTDGSRVGSGCIPEEIAPGIRLHDAPGLPRAPAARTAMMRYLKRLGRPGLRARPRHDSARLVHHEAQCGDRDGGGELARVQRPATPLLRSRDVAGLARHDRHARDLASPSSRGYDAVSLQPNAGSQGELAGLLAIRGYHRSRGDEQRTVCLIPSSAHGTNAASAVLAGMRVVVIATTEDRRCRPGRSARQDRRSTATNLAALMITYPLHPRGSTSTTSKT